MIQVDFTDRVKSIAGETNQPFGISMKVENMFTTGFLVKIINILCYGPSQ